MEGQEPGAQFACPGGRRTLSLHTCFSPILSNGGSLLIAQSQAPVSPLIYEDFLRCRKFGVSLRLVSTPFSVSNFSVLTHDFIKRCESNCKREGPGTETASLDPLSIPYLATLCLSLSLLLFPPCSPSPAPHMLTGPRAQSLGRSSFLSTPTHYITTCNPTI